MRLATLMTAIVLAAPTAVMAQSLNIIIDQSARITLPRPVHDVVLGNPNVADITVLDARHLMIIGKAYGVTNLMVTDEGGRTILNRQVSVGSPDTNHVSVWSPLAAGGLGVLEYTCAKRCQFAPKPTTP